MHCFGENNSVIQSHYSVILKMFGSYLSIIGWGWLHVQLIVQTFLGILSMAFKTNTLKKE